MSSHHIVREKQEPALLVLNIGKFSYEFLGQLLEWSPTVIATPDSFDELNSNEIKVDWLISENGPLELQNDVRIVPSAPGRYLTDALNELINKGYTAVNIITDSLNVTILESYIDEINLVIYSGDEKIFPIRPGYQKWMPAGEIITLKTPANKLTTSKLKKLSDKEYKVIVDGIISINFQQKHLLIAERL